MKKALITGITGQDGVYLSKLLLSKGYQVYGVTSQKLDEINFKNFELLNIDINAIKFINFESIKDFIEDGFEVYNFAGQSSIGESWKNPLATFQANIDYYINLLDILKPYNLKILQACSSEMFDIADQKINENSPVNPKSPYAISKFASYKYGQLIRKNEGRFIINAILFNHESKLRDARFVTRKIIDGVKAIAEKKQDYIELGNLDIIRDWGFAEEYVHAMWQLMQLNDPQDIIIATGNSISLREYIRLVFENFNIPNYESYIKLNPIFVRKDENEKILVDTSKLNSLGIKLTPLACTNISQLL